MAPVEETAENGVVGANKMDNENGDGGGGTAAKTDKDSVLSRKLKKILESDLDADSEMGEALAELSEFITENTLRTRRFLRGDIERRSLQV